VYLSDFFKPATAIVVIVTIIDFKPTNFNDAIIFAKIKFIILDFNY
jgi:hypothetical protein